MTAPFTPARLPQAYQAWNALLAEQLFPRGRAGVPVYLAVHDGLLGECGARRGLGGRAEFVQAVLGLATSPARLFVRLEQEAEFWSENGRSGPPPIIAGLAFAVLAAGEMATDENAKQTNYYFRLNALMGIESRSKPERFECTPDFWRLLQQWIRSDRRGELIVHGLKSQHPFVDPVQSQCLVRSCDILDFLPILNHAGHPPGQPPEPEDLLSTLRAWLPGPGAGSRLAHLLGRDPDDTALLQAAEAICDAAEDHLGDQPLDATTVKVEQCEHATITVRLNHHSTLRWKRARWFLRVPADIEAEEPDCLVMVGERLLIARLDVREPASYDTAISHEEAILFLRGQLGIRDEDGRDVGSGPQPVAWFQDEALQGRPGSWAPIKVPRAGIEHAVVCLEEDVFDEMEGALVAPPTRVAGAVDVWPGIGGYAAWSVVPRANSILPGNVVVRARPPLLRLNGGLRIRRGVYLRGGLPTPVASEAATVQAERIDGSTEIHTAGAGTFGALDLSEGRYAIHCDGATTQIFVLEPRWRECARPTLAAPLDRQVRAALQDATVRGARLEVVRPVYATFFRPGSRCRLYAPHVVKVSAPAGNGIYEQRTSQPPRHASLLGRVAAAPPLPRAPCFSEEEGEVNGDRSDDQQMAMNRLFEYASTRGAGSVDSVRQYCAVVAGDATWHSALSTLEDLGHIDVNWDERRIWTVAPPFAFPRAGDQSVSIITGARARHAVDWLKSHGVGAYFDSRASAPYRNLMPDCILAPTDALVRAGAVLQEVGLQLASEAPSMQMALQTRMLGDRTWWLGPEYFPPLALIRQTLKRWDAQLLRWTQASDLEGNGLYQWRERGRRMHYLVMDRLHATVRDPSAAKWFLVSNDRSYLAYEPGAQRLLVPSAMELPRIWKRICTIASGIMPARRGRCLIYEDIPLDLARAAAVRLNQSRMEGIS